MTLPNIKVLVTNNQTHFQRYDDGNLWYAIDYETTPDYAGAKFEYPVPISDTKGASLLRDDNALYHMRWIRKHLELLSNKEST